MSNLSDIVSSAFWRVNPPDADPFEVAAIYTIADAKIVRVDFVK